jgi:hypothetical protein
MFNVNQITSELAKMADPMLQKYAAMHKNDPYTVALAVGESNRRKAIRTAAQGRAAGQQRPKVVDQDIAEMAAVDPMGNMTGALPENMGIGRLPAPNMAPIGKAEGGIIGYDSNIRSGGNGARFLGIGGSQQYRVDEIVVSMRLISVNSGEVLLTTAVSKTIFSTQHNVGVLRFVDAGTKALELENGVAMNEPTTYAVRVAIEQAVYDMIVEGEKKGIWRYKKPAQAVVKEEVKIEEKKDVVIEPQPITETKPEAVLVPRVVPIVKKEEVKVEEKKDVVVQPQAVTETKTETLPSPPTEVKVEEKKVEIQKEDVKPNESKMAQVTARPLFGERKLREGSYLYATENEAGTKKWWFPKGSIVSVRQPGTEGWWRVMITDGSERGGWIRSSQLE